MTNNNGDDKMSTERVFKQPIKRVLLAAISAPGHITEAAPVGGHVTYLGESFVVCKGWFRRWLEPTGQVACPVCDKPAGIASDVDWGAPDLVTGEKLAPGVFLATCCTSFIRPTKSGWRVASSTDL